MSGIHLTQLQMALQTRLAADSGIAALSADIRDNVPPGSAYPYLAYGSARAKRKTTLGGTPASEIALDVHVFSRSGGRAETLTLLARIEAVLAATPPTLTGYAIGWWRLDGSTVTLGADGVTWRGTASVGAYLETT